MLLDNSTLCKKARAILRGYGYDVKLGHVYELFAILNDKLSWNHAKADQTVLSTVIKPQSWYCDTCGEVITSADKGYLDWLDTYDYKDPKQRNSYKHSYKIIHHKGASPNKNPEQHGCYPHEGKSRAGSSLTLFTGPLGQLHLLSLLTDYGSKRDQQIPGHVIQEWMEIFRRLNTPLYEDARRYWDEATSDGFFDGDHEYASYTEGSLKAVLKTYAGVTFDDK